MLLQVLDSGRCLLIGRIERKRLAMKACGVSGADRDVVPLELPEPPSPGPGQVLLREGPAAFTRVATGRASGRKLLLIP